MAKLSQKGRAAVSAAAMAVETRPSSPSGVGRVKERHMKKPMKKTLVRSAAIRQMLKDRQHELQNDIHRKLRSGRTEQRSDGRDEVEQSNDENQGDMDLVLLQMRADTLTRIDKALSQLDAGEYGICIECDEEIATPRLRALPFAVRCRSCEEEREATQEQAARQGQQPDAFSMLAGGRSF